MEDIREIVAELLTKQSVTSMLCLTYYIKKKDPELLDRLEDVFSDITEDDMAAAAEFATKELEKINIDCTPIKEVAKKISIY